MKCASEVCRARLQQVRGVNSDPGNGIQGGFAMTETLTSARVALITGANQGIGFEIARQLGKQGILVIASARDKQKGLAATERLQREGLQAHSLVLDVTVQSTIDAAVAEVDRKFGKLDILVNNAGIVAERTAPSESRMENFRKTFEINLFGLVAVTQAFLPLLRKAPAGRIVNMSSALGSLTSVPDPRQTRYGNVYLAYGASKAAVNSVTISFASELRDTAIKVNAAAPGLTATAMNNFVESQTVDQGAIAAVRLATLPADGPTGGFFDKNGTLPW
jgi:NAD(P)-dependent dehydrogenase (short-subunit alcohol dehydrogenase family)